MMIKKYLSIICILLYSQNNFGQRQSTFENWTTFTIEKKVKKFNFAAEQAWRVREFYMSRQTYTDITATYKANNFLEITGGYRLTFKNHMFSILEVNNRFYLDAELSVKSGDATFSYRSRLQHTRLQWEDDLGLQYETYNRHKFKFKYKVSDKIAFSAGYEIYLWLIPMGPLLNENRFSFEGQYKMNSKFSVSVGYILRNGVQVEDLLNTHVMNVGVSYKL